jgi:menaquinone-specific isochorismate synthase
MTAGSEPNTRLHATTRLTDAELDPFRAMGADGGAWWHDGWGFTTAGVAGRVHVDRLSAVLAAATVDDEVRAPGTGAIALGALPFAPADPTEWVIPARVTGWTPTGRGWVTTIGGAPHLTPVADDEPGSFSVARVQDRARWRTMVSRALAAIEAGALEKVVLAREVTIEADAPFDRIAVLHRLRAGEPGCFVFATGSLIGASPELLVRRTGATVTSRPMAGTVPAADAAALARLAASPKLAREHRLVIEAMRAALAPCCTSAPSVTGPTPVPLGDLAHLVTEISGELRAPAPSALELARLLHPTPAVGGTPTEPALRLIAELEPDGRGQYAGAVGWVDGRGDGELAVSLRSAELDGTRARLHAGAGIVDGSDADEEWSETEAKLLPMLRALVRA